MIAFDLQTETFVITDLGRIAAKYYIRYASVEVFNQKLKPKMSEADVLAMLCMSTEVRICLSRLALQIQLNARDFQFGQIQVRESEAKELEQLMEVVPCDVKVGQFLSYLSFSNVIRL